MERRIDNAEYMKAAKLIAACPKGRLPVVLDLIQKSGIDIDEALRAEMLLLDQNKKVLIENRRFIDKRKWVDTDNPFTLYLREAFEEGISFREICNMTGLNKTTLYKCLWGDRVGSLRTQAIVREAIEEIRCKN